MGQHVLLRVSPDFESTHKLNLQVKWTCQRLALIPYEESEHLTQNLKAMSGLTHDIINPFRNSYTTNKGQVYA